MAYIIVRGSEAQGGYVSMVEKGRVDGSVRTKAYICGLGSMTMGEFKAFQKWAHSLKPQEYRKLMVLSSGKAITEKETIPKRAESSKEAIEVQKVIKRKMGKKTVTPKTKRTVRKHFPVPVLKGYKGKITHTEIMMLRNAERKEQKAAIKKEQKYHDISPEERDIRKVRLLAWKKAYKKEWRHWDLIISEGGLYSAKQEKGDRAKAARNIKRVDVELKRIQDAEKAGGK